ncbi:periplasmic heavy metal sensor [Aestuariivita boseongensis]|uniref:periplasmic heavy metal sensor n=1 Tax=Aestuariivita boseongensis TaxID=1470562 RepID=UPI000681B0AB|nr:periplasmic heavy metal sensor [Aestuariivita boseongensis]
MTDNTQPAHSQWSRGLRVLFGLSLALNLLVVGALAGAWLRHGWSGHDMHRGGGGMGRILYQELPQDARRALRQDLRGSLDRDMMRATRIGPALDKVLRAETLDLDALRDLMARHAAALQTGQNAMREGWLKTLAGMSREERMAYADRLRDRAMRRSE